MNQLEKTNLFVNHAPTKDGKWVLTIWLNVKPLSRNSMQIGLAFHPTYENMENTNKTLYGIMSNILFQ